MKATAWPTVWIFSAASSGMLMSNSSSSSITSSTVSSESAVALLDDRDLAAMCSRLEGDLEAPNAALSLNWAGRLLTVGRIAQAGVAARFGFIQEPGLASPA